MTTSIREQFIGSLSTTDGTVIVGACDVGIEYDVSKKKGLPSLYEWCGDLHTEQAFCNVIPTYRKYILNTKSGESVVHVNRANRVGKGWRIEFVGRRIPPMTMRVKAWLHDRGFCE